MKRVFKESELILNDRGAVYHLDLLPNEIADTIITVGDPQRVKKVSQYFDTVDIKRKKREFKTHTGTLNGMRISVISTGIGSDNIDIVLNELDALVNVDLETRTEKDELKSLNFIRIGTSGGLREDLDIESFVVNTHAIGMDGLGTYYGEADESKKLGIHDSPLPLYTGEASQQLVETIGRRMIKGVGITAGGFYAPQGRSIRYRVDHDKFISNLSSLSVGKIDVTNMEMETAALYMLAKKLGHNAVSCNVILANRVTGIFSQMPGECVDRLIRSVLQELTHSMI